MLHMINPITAAVRRQAVPLLGRLQAHLRAAPKLDAFQQSLIKQWYTENLEPGTTQAAHPAVSSRHLPAAGFLPLGLPALLVVSYKAHQPMQFLLCYSVRSVVLTRCPRDCLPQTY